MKSQVANENTELLRIHGRPLGPLQAVWDAWEPVTKGIIGKPASHFILTLVVQIAEILAALEAGDKAHAAEEMVDLMSVAQNWMRSIGLSDLEVAEAIVKRAQERYVGQAAKIMKKYEKAYGV